MIVFGGIVGVLYLVIIVILFFGSFQLTEFFSEEDQLERTKFSIIIPFRNEAKNLLELLISIQKINYPLDCFEVIFVDDDSVDESVKVIHQFFKTNEFTSTKTQYKVIKNVRNSNSPKKDAITWAISNSVYDWIITTDADGEVPPNWLAVFHSFIMKKQALLIAAPIGLKKQKSLIGRYQIFDLLSLQTVTMGGFGNNHPFLCNGANLCYKKEVFNQVAGYKGNDHITSGDDVFLLEKIKKMYPNKVHFLKSKEAIVYTKPEDNWLNLIAQRVRWASKTSSQENAFSKAIGLIVFTCNLLFIIGFLFIIINNEYLKYFLLFWMLKLIVDFLFIIPTASFLRIEISFFNFVISSLLYPFITTTVVIKSVFGSYNWKGRSFKK